MVYTIKENENMEFAYDLANIILKQQKPPLFLCVGSNKIVADSLGCITGELLYRYYNINNIVIGNIYNPIISTNIESTLNKIKETYHNNSIIVIDSSVGHIEDLYKIKLNNFGLQINYQNNNKLIGDASISSVCYVKGINGLLILKSEEKKLVFKVANYIAWHIKLALEICEKINKNLVKNENGAKMKIF